METKLIQKLKLLIIVLIISQSTFAQQEQPIELFNGKDFTGWYTFLETNGKGNDPKQVFQVTDGMLHISGQEFGYISTHDEFENFHLTLEFKWGKKKFPPRENAKRDSGILYQFSSNENDTVWPASFECQIQEGDCGDFWLVGGKELKAIGEKVDHPEWGLTQWLKTEDAENPTGEWNKVEVMVSGHSCLHIVNGVIVNMGRMNKTEKGKILLQSEGSEIYYKNIQLQKL